MAPNKWSGTGWAVILLGTGFVGKNEALQVEERQKDVEHRIEKAQAQITALQAFAKRREATMCASDYNLCPPSLNGDCCPQSYRCETDACYATTAGAGGSSACGKVGFYDCPVSVGGGCCPEGFVCGAQVCYPPAGASNMSTTCSTGYYLCPASLNFGCCQKGMGCGVNTCYVTTPSTAFYTKTVTITLEGGETTTSTRTVTTVQSPRVPTGVPATSNAVGKLMPTKVDKLAATSTPEPGGGGMNKAQLGGIIGGAIVVLLVVVTTAFIVVRRLNRVSAETAKANASSTDDPDNPRRPQMAQYQHGHSSSLSNDPLIFETPGQSATNTPHEISAHSDFSHPPITPAYLSGTPSQEIRHPSMDSSQGGNGSYFDIPARVSNIPGGVRHSLRTSTDSNMRPYQQHHARQYSNTSDISATSSDGLHVGSPLIPAELDISGGFVPELPVSGEDRRMDRRRSGSSTIASSRASVTQGRRYSAASVGSPTGGTTGQQQVLGVVSESRGEEMHGFYGPGRGVAGQTAAGLGEGRDSGDGRLH